MTIPQIRFVDVGSTRIRVRESGDPAGEPVLLLHGIGRSLEDWDPQHEFLSRYRVVAVDLAGFGHSDRVPGPATLEKLADTALATLDALGETRPAHVMGNSLGGAVALLISTRHPDQHVVGVDDRDDPEPAPGQQVLGVGERVVRLHGLDVAGHHLRHGAGPQPPAAVEGAVHEVGLGDDAQQVVPVVDDRDGGEPVGQQDLGGLVEGQLRRDRDQPAVGHHVRDPQRRRRPAADPAGPARSHRLGQRRDREDTADPAGGAPQPSPGVPVPQQVAACDHADQDALVDDRDEPQLAVDAHPARDDRDARRRQHRHDLLGHRVADDGVRVVAVPQHVHQRDHPDQGEPAVDDGQGGEPGLGHPLLRPRQRCVRPDRDDAFGHDITSTHHHGRTVTTAASRPPSFTVRGGRTGAGCS